MPLPPDASLEEVKLRIRETNKNPNVGKVTTVVLKDGPRSYKLATLFEVLEANSKALHHYYLRLDHVRRDKDGWHSKVDKIITLEDDTNKELRKLYLFLAAVYGEGLAGATGDVRLVSAENYARVEEILRLVPDIAQPEKLSLFGELLRHLDVNQIDPDRFADLLKATDRGTLRYLAAASRMVEYTAAYEELRRLVDNPKTSESTLQAHLRNNAWMFGSEYSELLPRRTWTRDDQVDYMLRRTVDGFLEIVEIKTAFSEPLLLKDTSHDSYYASAKLSPVIGQVIRYIDEVDRNRDSILAKDNLDALKIRARIIIGRDGEPEHQAGLRNFNAHLNRIEIITFDQLLRICERVLAMFRGGSDTKHNPEFDDDIPF